MSLLDRVRIALGNEEELARLADELEANRMRVGDYGWCGPVCLQCTAIDEHGSHRSRVVATAVVSVDGDDDWHWACPECGAPCQAHGIHVRDDPRCFKCRSTERFEDRCPPTLRDPGLPPPPPGIRDAGDGATDHE